MKRTLLLIAALTVAFSGRSFAALGDTEDKIADLLGKPTSEGFPDARGVSTNMYQKGNYIVLVQFLHHLSLAESYTRTDKAERGCDAQPQPCDPALARRTECRSGQQRRRDGRKRDRRVHGPMLE